MYVALDSWFRANKDAAVYVFVEAPLTSDERRDIQNVVESFNVKSCCFRTEHVGTLRNSTEGLKTVFDDGCDEAIITFEDTLVRSDIFDYLDNAPRLGFALNLIFGRNRLRERYYTEPNLIGKQNFKLLYEWLESKVWVGMTVDGLLLTEKNAPSDGTYRLFVDTKGWFTWSSDRPYALNFGVWNSRPFLEPTDEQLEVQEEMFSGPRDKWLENITSMVERKVYHPKIMFPAGFRYS